MTTIRILSWNIESLGDAKTVVTNPVTNVVSQSELVNFINLVIRKIDADIVGIMEVKSGIGPRILDWLLVRLNNGGPVPWKGRVSSRQDGGTQEETLYLWREKTNILQLDAAGFPAPISSIGIVDQNVLETTFAALKITTQPVTQNALLAALQAAGYITKPKFKVGSKLQPTKTWRMNADQWNALATAKNPAVKFGATPPPVAMNPAQLQALAAQLIGTDILRFIGYAHRSPFLANFLVGSPAKKLMLALLHAPGPGEIIRLDAINVIGLSTSAAAADNLVLMGDFNIAENQAGDLAVEYGRFAQAGKFTFDPLVPRRYQPVFDPVENAPLTAGNQALPPPARTTLIDTWLDDTAPAKSVLGNTYDKFFFRGNASPGSRLKARAPRTWNMIDHLNGADAVNLWLTQATSAMTFFRGFRGNAYLVKADARFAKQEAEQQKEFTKASGAVTNIQQQIKASHPPASSPLYLRLANQTAKANKAKQKVASCQRQRGAIAVVQNVVNNAGLATPTGVGTALAIYREAISDHFPISLDVDT